MEQTPRILLVHEVASLLRVATVTVYRHLAQRRQGIGTFPLPISVAGGKLRWLSTDIDDYLKTQSNMAPSVNVPRTKERKREEREHKARQESAKARLDRHRLNRTVKGGQEP